MIILKRQNLKLMKKDQLKDLKLIESFIETGQKPEWMILNNHVPVIPPELRPLVPLRWWKVCYIRSK